jgi:hypothetical protein
MAKAKQYPSDIFKAKLRELIDDNCTEEIRIHGGLNGDKLSPNEVVAAMLAVAQEYIC